MAVTGLPFFVLSVFIISRYEGRHYVIPRNDEFIALLAEKEKDFWENHVQKGVLPEPDGSGAANRFISSYFKESRQDFSIALDGFDERLRRRMEIEEAIDRLTAEKQQIEQEVKVFMKNAEYAENEKYLVSWKNVTTNRIDAKRLKEEMPEIYEKFCKETTSRRFLIKAA